MGFQKGPGQTIKYTEARMWESDKAATEARYKATGTETGI